jgi:hypothetical protein
MADNSSPFGIPQGSALIAVSDNEGAISGSGTSSSGVGSTAAETTTATDPFWFVPTLDEARWNQSFPYQLVVVEVDQSGNYVTSGLMGAFTLPIPPQEITLQMPVAIATTVTMGGAIIEEHNAAPFRLISFQGTMGVMPVRTSGSTLSTTPWYAAIASGTIRGLKNTAKLAGSVLSGNTFSGNSPLVDDNIAKASSGYKQWRLLQQFLEKYLTLKKTSEGAKLRLALAIWKDQAIYLVTPIDFTTRKGASSPNEYTYSLAFKAWKRVTLEPGYSAVDIQVTPRQPNTINQVLNRLTQARRTIASARNVVSGFMGDVDRVLETMREASFAIKELTGVVQSVIDLPKNIIADAQQSYTMLANSVSGLGKTLGISGGKDPVGVGVSSKDQAVYNKLVQANATSGKGLVGSANAPSSGADPINKILANPDDNYTALERIRVGDLKLTPSINQKIAAERDRVSRFTRTDWENKRDLILKAAQDMADSIGAGDSNFNSTYNRNTTIADHDPTDDQFEILYAMNEVVLSLNYMAASGDVNPVVSPMAYVAGLAAQSGIAFKQAVSKLAVPYPYGNTLEQVAARYLGDPNRWHEIATLNGLQSPYVDETGFDLTLLVDGRTNQVVISDVTNLYVGQPVWLSSGNTSRTQRHIRMIERIDSSYYLITLDGDTDLDRFTTFAGSTLHAFLPNTVNSQMMIYIPSDKPTNENYFNTKSIPGINIFDSLIQVGGVDLMLTASGDLAVTQDGDCRLAIGLNNIIQRIRTTLGTRKGSFLQHPEFGLSIRPGTSVADLSATELARLASNLFSNDPSISGVSGVSVQIKGPVATITLAITVAGTNQTIPVSVNIQR